MDYGCIDEEVFTDKYVLVNESIVDHRAIFQILKSFQCCAL